ASELDELIFQKGQTSLQRELHDFVEAFETKKELLELDSLAKTYVQLTNCEGKLKSSAVSQLETTLKEAVRVNDVLNSALKQVESVQVKEEPFRAEREAYLKSKEERRKVLESEIRRESDKIDEYYAKKTRESIYSIFG
ncbi:hypothetical protein INT47_009315, partial [Mucor saturninus]